MNTQELIKAWANWARVKRPRHTCGSAERKYRAPSDIDTDTPTPSGITMRDIYACDDAWRKLPLRYRQLLKYVYVTRWPDDKTARILGMSESMVQVHHDHAIKLLAVWLNQQASL